MASSPALPSVWIYALKLGLVLNVESDSVGFIATTSAISASEETDLVSDFGQAQVLGNSQDILAFIPRVNF